MNNKVLGIALIILAIVSLFVGVSDLRYGSVNILVLSRIPRMLAIIFAGMSMSISGLIMQQLSRNKFVAPSTATTVDSAKLGALISLIIFPSASSLGKMLIAFAFSLAGTSLFMKILRSVKQKNVILVPLIGIMLGNIIDAATTVLAYRYDLVQNISTWMMGNFSMIIKGRYELLYISIPLVIVAFLYANRFTIAGMGEDFAVNLGMNYNQVVNIGLTIVALLTSVVTITVGRIPFLGLVVPNLVTMYRGDHLQKNVLTTGLFGAVFLLVCDLFGRLVIYPYEVSIGLTVGVIGSIAFLYILLRRRGA